VAKRILPPQRNLKDWEYPGVYIAARPDSPRNTYKMGKSVNIARRVSNHGCMMVVVCAVRCEEPLRLERALRSRFANYRVAGEWYWISPEDIEWLKTFDHAEFLRAGDYSPLPSPDELLDAAMSVYDTPPNGAPR
jgi:hypothetical protein